MEYEIICAVCGLPIEGEDLLDRHWGHEKDCPRHDDPDADVDCCCDLEYHEACCPDCNEEEEEEEEEDIEGLMWYGILCRDWQGEEVESEE